MPTIPPTNDLELDNWQGNFGTRINSTPTAFGLQSSDATAFNALGSDFHTKLLAATNPGTRTKSAIEAKNISKKALTAKARQLIKICSAFPALSPVQRDDLGLNIPDTVRTPVPAPSTRPVPTLQPDGRVTWVDETNTTKRGKPAGYFGAFLFTKIDGPAPATIADCGFVAMVTRTSYKINIPPGNNGKTLWLLMQWTSETGAPGPVSVVASTVIIA